MAIESGSAEEGPVKPSFWIGRLSHEHDRTFFACGKDPLDRFLRDQVFDCEGRDLASTYVLVSTTHPWRVLCCYTLSITNVAAGELPKSRVKRFPRSAEIGAVLLGRLAVDQESQRSGFGRFLLLDAIDQSLDIRDRVASNAMVVDAIDEEAAAFLCASQLPAVSRNPRANVPSV